MKLTEACIEKPVFAWMIMLATIVFGAVAATRIGISQMPDVDLPTISVSVAWEGEGEFAHDDVGGELRDLGVVAGKRRIAQRQA